MSVPEYKRNQSKVEFLSNFHKLRKETNIILMRDFGIKKRTYEIQLIEDIYKLTEEDKKLFTDLADKYGIKSGIVDKYPEWLINSWRDETREIMAMLGIEIEIANSIYFMTEHEYSERRIAWDKSIGYCNALKDKLQEIITTIKVSVGAYEVVSNLLQKEINLIKGVRKSDKERWEKIKQQQPQSDKGN